VQLQSVVLCRFKRVRRWYRLHKAAINYSAQQCRRNVFNSVDEELQRRCLFEDMEEYLKEVCDKFPSFRSKLRENVLDLYERVSVVSSL
jgi:16S rRNA U1498 N3-methylase RsmE